MSLRIWLPMTKDLRNQGLSNVTVTNNGATFDSAGKLGGCYSFGTGNSYLTIDHTPLKDFTEVSIAFWIKIINWNVNYATIIDAKNGTGYAWHSEIFAVQRYGNYNALCFNIANGSSSISGAVRTNTLELNTWYHIVCTYESGSCKIYQDGTLVSTYTTSIVPNFNSIANCFIGNADGNVYQFNGSLNDVRIYDHALSPMEVKRLSQGLILHYPLSNNGWGQENLASQYIMPGVNNPGITTTTRGRTNYYGDYGISIPATENADTYFSIWYSEPLESGTTYTLSAEVSGLLSGSYYNFPLFAQNNTSMGIIKFDHNGLNTLTFTMNYTDTIATATYNGKTYYHMFMDDIDRAIASGQGAITIKNIKLEKGSIATPWCPNKNDTLYTSLGYNDGIEYDTSGFGNNGTRVGDFNWSTDTPRYLVSTEFSGNSTCVRTSDNNWIARPIEEFTVNLWAYKDDWSTYGGQRLFSCTEGAGFNTEQISQSISFPINVYTSEARTSRQYTDSAYRPLIPLSSITSGWHMFTFTYSTSKISSYLDGELVDSKSYTSYGAFCGDNIPLCIGAEATGSFGTAGGHFIGKISDFKLFYTELDSADILSLYQTSAYIDSQGNTYASSYVEG